MKLLAILTTLTLITASAEIPADFPAEHYYEQAKSDVILAWDPNPEPDLAGYKLHYGGTSGDYNRVVNVGNVTTYTLEVPNGGYFMAVTAYNAAGLESLPSNEIYVDVAAPPGKPSGLRVVVTDGDDGSGGN